MGVPMSNSLISSRLVDTSFAHKNATPVLNRHSSRLAQHVRTDNISAGRNRMACAIIGVCLSFASLGTCSSVEALEREGSGVLVVEVGERRGGVGKWSEARRCPEWHTNSLETVVPENLPRPHGRMSQELGLVTKSGPSLVGKTKAVNSINPCFSV